MGQCMAQCMVWCIPGLVGLDLVVGRGLVLGGDGGGGVEVIGGVSDVKQTITTLIPPPTTTSPGKHPTIHAPCLAPTHARCSLPIDPDPSLTPPNL